MELHLTSEMPPSVNHYLGYRAVIKNGRAIGMSYITQEAEKYKKAFAAYVIEEVEKQGWDLEPNKCRHFYVDTVFYFDRIDMDANNYFKCLLDAITDTQKIWLDDNVVCERVQRIYYDSNNPRVEFVIHPVEYVGVFDNASQMEDFMSTVCIGCTRGQTNCSVMKKAAEGRIVNDLRAVGGTYVCDKFKKCKDKKENTYGKEKGN